jgi:hypothetical protein
MKLKLHKIIKWVCNKDKNGKKGLENFKDTNGVIRRRKWNKDRQHNGQKKKDTKVCKTLHWKLNTEQHKSHYKQGCKSKSSEMLCSYCSTCGTCHVTLVTEICQERGKNRIASTTNGTYPWSFLTHCHFRSVGSRFIVKRFESQTI